MARLLYFVFASILFTNVAYSQNCIEKWQSAQLQDPSLTSSPLFANCDGTLKKALQQQMTQDHVALHYNGAKQALFREVDSDDSEQGACSVYSPGHCHREYPLNVEHTWPQSFGAGKKPMISDMHHLFLAEVESNSTRSNYPFCDVERIEWEYGGSKLGYAAEGRQLCFEPPLEHKGNVARALFYFATRYGKSINRMQETILRRWHKLDPVNDRDLVRNDRIEALQGNRNQFIDHPVLIDLISDF